jgi:hypothetical protein
MFAFFCGVLPYCGLIRFAGTPAKCVKGFIVSEVNSEFVTG